MAAQLGGTVGELKARMSYPEFQHWVAFHKHEPLGGQRLDLHMTMILKALLKLLGGQDVAFDKLAPQFWPIAAEPVKELTADELKTKAMTIFGALTKNGTS